MGFEPGTEVGGGWEECWFSLHDVSCRSGRTQEFVPGYPCGALAHLFVYVRMPRAWMSRGIFTGLRPRLRRLSFLLLVLVSLACAEGGLRTLAAQTTSSWTLDGVLGMMDKSAQDFHTLTADIEHIKYTAVVSDTSTETGHIFVRRDETMRIEIVKPDSRTILRTGDS